MAEDRSVLNRLFDAIADGDLESVKDSLECGANVNEKLGWSPLHAATFAGNLDIVKFLVQNGAQLDVKDKWGNKTPLEYAYMFCNADIVNYFKTKSLEISKKMAEEDAKKKAEAENNADIVNYFKKMSLENSKKKAEKDAKKKAEAENMMRNRLRNKRGTLFYVAGKKAQEKAQEKTQEKTQEKAKKKAETFTKFSSANVMDGDYYSIFGVRKGARLNDELKLEMKRVYKRLALEYHPDKNESADAMEKFKKIKKAYEVLTDPQKKQVYDQYGEEGLNKKNWN